MSPQLKKLLNAPLSDISNSAGNMKSSTLNELGIEAESLAQRLAFIGEYLSTRGGMGCGDQGHETAIKAANKVTAKVRKAMGFTYPVSGLATVRF